MINITMTPDSSVIKCLSYNANKLNGTGTLWVYFTSGQVYFYSDVPSYDVITMIGEASVGSFFAKNIRPFYEFTKI